MRFCRQVSPQPPRAQRCFRISRLVVAAPLSFLSVEYMADRELEVVVSNGNFHTERRTCQVLTLTDYPTLLRPLHLRVSDVSGASRMPYFSH